MSARHGPGLHLRVLRLCVPMWSSSSAGLLIRATIVLVQASLNVGSIVLQVL